MVGFPKCSLIKHFHTLLNQSVVLIRSCQLLTSCYAPDHKHDSFGQGALPITIVFVIA